MTTRPSTISVESLEHRRPPLPYRENQISRVLTGAIHGDRECRLIDAYIDEHFGKSPKEERFPSVVTLEKPVYLVDAVSALGDAHAELAALLMPQIVALVDRCLDISSEWDWLDWLEDRPERADRALVEIFEGAGIADRYVSLAERYPERHDDEEVGS